MPSCDLIFCLCLVTQHKPPLLGRSNPYSPGEVVKVAMEKNTAQEFVLVGLHRLRSLIELQPAEKCEIISGRDDALGPVCLTYIAPYFIYNSIVSGPTCRPVTHKCVSLYSGL